MIQSMAVFFTRVMQRWLPDAFLFAVLLTFVVLLLGVLGRGHSPAAMVQFWGDGLWNLLAFSMQVLLTLVTGHVLAQAPPIRRGLGALAALARSPGQAIVLMTLVALVCCWINWGFGLIAGALFAREMASRVKGVHYPLLVASAYSGMLIWHAGLSGSIPLKIAVAEGGALGQLMGGQSIPLAATIFSSPTLLICLALLISLPLINRLMLPPPHAVVEFRPPQSAAAADQLPPPTTPAQKLEHSRALSLLLGAMGAYYLFDYFSRGGSVGLNIVNFSFLVLGLLLHRSAAGYLAALRQAIGGCSGIILQFPLYAGIMGMMVESGLAADISQWFVSVSTAQTFPLLTFLSAGIVNFFVPSGGGQWAVQAPIVMPAAESLGVPLERAAMAVAFGDAWTNMVQPFWALPLLGIAGLGIKDIMGYCTVALLWSGLVISAGMWLFY